MERQKKQRDGQDLGLGGCRLMIFHTAQIPSQNDVNLAHAALPAAVHLRNGTKCSRNAAPLSTHVVDKSVEILWAAARNSLWHKDLH